MNQDLRKHESGFTHAILKIGFKKGMAIIRSRIKNRLTQYHFKKR